MYRFLQYFSIIFILLVPVCVFSENIETSPAGGDIYKKNYFEYFYELQDRIEILEEESQELRERDTYKNINIGEYEKILSKSKAIADEKENAYNQAINNLKLWISFFGTILIILLWVFGYIRKGDLKDAREELDDKAKDLDKKITYFRDTIIGDIKGSMSSSIKDQISILLDDGTGGINKLLSEEDRIEIIESVTNKILKDNSMNLKIAKTISDNFPHEDLDNLNIQVVRIKETLGIESN